jgi:hypothetical protein
MPGREQEAVMSALLIANPATSERRLTGAILFLLAGLAALATNIILPAFPRIGASLGVSSQELGLFPIRPATGSISLPIKPDPWRLTTQSPTDSASEESTPAYYSGVGPTS